MKLSALIAQVSSASRYEALVAGVMAALFLVIVASLHFIKPQLKPSVHMISEYAMRPKGWIMRTAFFCIAVSCFSLALAIWPYITYIGSILLVIDGLAFAGAGAFVTDPLSAAMMDKTQSGNLHNIFSFIVIPSFPVMATVVGISMSGNGMWAPVQVWLPVLYSLTWVGFIGFLGSAVYSARHPSTPVFGYFQRFMVLAYAGYLITIALLIFQK